MNAVAQRMTALEKANRVRLAKVMTKRTLGELDAKESVAYLAELIESDDATMAGMKLGEALLACRHMGVQGMGRIVKHAGVMSADRKIRDLTDRQRRDLVHALRSPSVMPPRYR